MSKNVIESKMVYDRSEKKIRFSRVHGLTRKLRV
jgi:hypothetical protein